MEHNTHRALTEFAAVITAGDFILPGRYIISAGDVSRDSLGRIWITHVCQSVGIQGRSQSVFRCSSSSEGEHYFCTSNLDQVGALKSSFHKL